MNNPRTVPLRTAIGMVAGTAAVFFAGVYAAHAGPGVPNVSPRTSFTISGHLTGVGTSTMPGLTYTFRKGGSICNPLPVMETYDPATTNYSVQLDYSTTADGGVACPAGFFDGSDITVDVYTAGGTRVVSGQPINPVPYAQFAASAGSAQSATSAVTAGRATNVAFANSHDAVVTAFAGACVVPAAGTPAGGYFVTEVNPSVSCAVGCMNARAAVGNPGAGVSCVAGLTFTSEAHGPASTDGQHYFTGHECIETGPVPSGLGVTSRLCCCLEADAVLPWGGGP